MHISFNFYLLASALVAPFALGEENNAGTSNTTLVGFDHDDYDYDDGYSDSSFQSVMTPYGFACPPGLFILSEDDCFHTAYDYKISKLKKTSSVKYPYGCGLKGRNIYFNTNEEAYNPPGRKKKSICRTREVREISWYPQETLQLCEGNCEYDDECADDLVCFERDYGDNKSGGVPGCGETLYVNPDMNFCIHPEDNPGVDAFMRDKFLFTGKRKVGSEENDNDNDYDYYTHPPTQSDDNDDDYNYYVSDDYDYAYDTGKRIVEDYDDEGYTDGIVAKTPTDYVLKFTIEPKGISDFYWSSIIKVKSGSGECTIGFGFNNWCDSPSVYFVSGTKLLVITDSDEGQVIQEVSFELALNTEYKVEIYVVSSLADVYVNDNLETSSYIGTRESIYDARVYIGGGPNDSGIADALISNIYFGPA